MVHRIAPPPEIEGLTWVRALGSGGFADVHLYRQFLPARDVAVKVVRDPTESGSVVLPTPSPPSKMRKRPGRSAASRVGGAGAWLTQPA